MLKFLLHLFFCHSCISSFFIVGIEYLINDGNNGISELNINWTVMVIIFSFKKRYCFLLHISWKIVKMVGCMFLDAFVKLQILAIAYVHGNLVFTSFAVSLLPVILLNGLWVPNSRWILLQGRFFLSVFAISRLCVLGGGFSLPCTPLPIGACRVCFQQGIIKVHSCCPLEPLFVALEFSYPISLTNFL